MKLAPVRKRRPVGYPALSEKGDVRTFLSENIPARWKNTRMASAFLSAVLLLSELGKSKGYAGESDTTEQSVELRKTNRKPRGGRWLFGKRPTVAPIFDHGEGRGVAGCVVLAPPVFISEDEARDMVEAEFNKYGVSFQEQDVKLNGGVYLDGLSKEHGIGFVFASAADHQRWEWKPPSVSSVTEYNIRRLAKRLRRRLKRNDECIAGVFYDPMPKARGAACLYGEDYDAYYSALQSGWKEAYKRARTLIQWQVRDFIAWLTCNGYLEPNNSAE